MVLPPSFSRKMVEIETVEAEKMGWIYLPRGTFTPLSPIGIVCKGQLSDSTHTSYQSMETKFAAFYLRLKLKINL